MKIEYENLPLLINLLCEKEPAPPYVSAVKSSGRTTGRSGSVRENRRCALKTEMPGGMDGATGKGRGISSG